MCCLTVGRQGWQNEPLETSLKHEHFSLRRLPCRVSLKKSWLQQESLQMWAHRVSYRGKLSSVIGKALDNTGRVPHSEGIAASLRETSPRVTCYWQPWWRSVPLLDLLGLAPGIQHERGERPGNEKGHQIRSCLKSGFGGENNEFWKTLILDACIENLFHAEPRGCRECHDTQATSNSVQSVTSRDPVEMWTCHLEN